MQIANCKFENRPGTVTLIGVVVLFCAGCSMTERRNSSQLLNPNAPAMNRRAPEVCKVRLETSKGDIVIEMHRTWTPHGADRFYNLVRARYYDEARFYRVIEGKW